MKILCFLMLHNWHGWSGAFGKRRCYRCNRTEFRIKPSQRTFFEWEKVSEEYVTRLKKYGHPIMRNDLRSL